MVRPSYIVTLAVAASMLIAPATTAQAYDDRYDGAEIEFTRWDERDDWREGERDGVMVLPGRGTGVIMARAAGTTEYDDPHGETATWEYATWTSSVVDLPFSATELVASWNAVTPGASWISVEMQGRYADGSKTPWYVLGNWASSTTGIARTSVDGQNDGRSEVLTDTVAVTSEDDDALLEAYQIRVTMHRPPGSMALPRVWMVAAMASNVPERFAAPPSDGGMAWGRELAVPRRSTSTHQDHPEYGSATGWSSPASTSMVMEYFGAVPSRADMDWIEAGYKDPQVAHAARMTWDHTFEATGNWPFNTAYAASVSGLEAFVTRLRSLDDVERLIDAGIPVITSQSFDRSELDGANYSTPGHLMVITGFTDDGDVIVNDPRARSNAAVRRVYDREQFETVWLRTQRDLADGSIANASGGIVYIIRPRDVDLPDDHGPGTVW